jgi:hypothetical protein
MDAAFANRLRKCANDMLSGAGVESVPLALDLAADEIDALRELIDPGTNACLDQNRMRREYDILWKQIRPFVIKETKSVI